MEKLTERPPFVRFEMRPIEDRAASLEAGHVVMRDVPHVLVTPAGTANIHVAIAEEWLAQKDAQARANRLPADWARQYRQAYKAWREDEEAPIDGTPLTHWPSLTKSQLEALKALNYRSVEDVAAMTEEGIGRMGLGGRNLKNRAIAFLEAKSSPQRFGEQVVALQEQNDTLKGQLGEAMERLQALADQKNDKPSRRGKSEQAA